MSNVPDGAELSEDGQWWWDADNQTWQPVEGGGGEGGGGEGGGGEGGGDAGFDFVQGIRIDPVSMGTPSANEELKAAFQVINTGTAAGQCVVTIYVDGSDSGVTWDSPWLEPGQDAVPDGDGYVAGIPGQSEGEHEFEGFADPPGQYGGRSGVNKINVGSPEG